MKHCLVIDDSAVIRKVARRILEGLSLRATEAEDGEQALSACRAEMPDVLMVDASLPSMDGCDFVRQLRATPGGERPKIVFCPVEHDIAQIARARHAGVDVVLLKPFDKAMVTTRLQDIGIV